MIAAIMKNNFPKNFKAVQCCDLCDMKLKNDGSFHQAIFLVLLMGNFLGFPVCEINAKTTLGLKFSWKSFRAVYSIFLISMSIFILLCYVHWLFLNGEPNLAKVNLLIDFFMNFLSVICFQRLAQKWPKLICQWSFVEESLPILKNFKDRNFLKKRITTMSVVVMLICMGKFDKINLCFTFGVK